MMSDAWLTADVVEQIHQAVLTGRETSTFVSKLTNATLTGITEYGCLRRLLPQLPSLPTAITNSPLGRSLSKVVSEIGLRTSGTRPSISNSPQPQEVEFVTVDGETEAVAEPMGMLYMRFTQATKAAGFPVQTANELQAAFNEMIENAVQHSNPPIPVLAGYQVRSGIAQFVVADVGRGVLDSLRENAAYAETKTDAEAVRLALHDGVSRFVDRGGFGFRPIFKAITEAWGTLRFRSGNGCLTMDGTGLDADQGTRHFPSQLPGFQVSVTCRMKNISVGIPLV
jgi:anti-sigma regulatory factor (Ser/Thr protein kinase)